MFISIHAITEYPKLLSILSSRHHYFHHVTGRFYSSSAAATAIGRKNLKRSVLLPHQPKSGHNLTSRGELLTKAVRRQLKPKDENSNNVNSDGGGEMIEVGSVDSGMTLKMPVAKVFRGMIVPEKPIPPGPDECCMSGCAICVYDLYITSLEAYRDSLKSVRTALASKSVPVSEWPKELQEELDLDNAATPRQDPDSGIPNSGLDVSLLAFAELEKSLRLQRKEESNE